MLIYLICSLLLDNKYNNGTVFAYLLVALWSSYVLAEQLSIAFLLVVKVPFNAAIAVTYVLVISIALASGTVRYEELTVSNFQCLNCLSTPQIF